MDLDRGYDWQADVTNAIQVTLPGLTLASYAIAFIVSMIKSETTLKTKKWETNFSKRATAVLTTGVILLFFGQCVLLASQDASFAISANGSLVYSLFSLLTWVILDLGLLDTDETKIAFRYSAPWTISFALETSLLVLASNRSELRRKAQFACSILQGIRLALILGLICLPVIAKIKDRREQGSDEEIAPLLIAGIYDDENSPALTTNGKDYGSQQLNGHIDSCTVSGDTSDNGNKDDKTSDKKVDKKDDNSADDEDEEDIERNTGNLTKSWSVYGKALAFFLPYCLPKTLRLQFHMAVLCLCVVARRFLNVLVPILLGSIIDKLNTPGLDNRVPWESIFLYMGFRVLDSSAGLHLLEDFLWLPIDKNAQVRLSNAAYVHLMQMSCDFHDTKKSGMVWQTINRGTGVTHLFHIVSFELFPMVVDLVVAISVFWYLFDSYMAFIVACVVFLYLWATKKAIALRTTKQRAYIKCWESEYHQLTESSMNWATISYFNRLKYEIGRYATTVRKTQDATIVYHMVSYAVSAIRASILNIGLFAGLCLAAYQIVYGHRKVGDFVVLFTYWAELTSPLQYFSYGFQSIARQLVDAEKLLALLTKDPSVQDSEGAAQFVFTRGEVEFKNVAFSYDGKRQIINDVSLHAEPGHTIALVGETGGGKSTLLKLMFRFYDVTAGDIYIDGQSIRDVTLESLREHIGVVPQDPVLFNQTILENLRYAKLDASEGEVQAACKAVALHEKIMSFTKGYQEKVGERGVKMSGGELQRMAIARAILMDPKILLLDEATSSVDSETEAQIQTSLHNLCAGRTTFVIAHRLSTIVHADLVVVVNNGQIVERGTHDELLKTKGHYHKLWARQLRVQSGVSRSESKSRFPNQKDEAGLVNDLSSGTDDAVALKDAIGDALTGENDNNLTRYEQGQVSGQDSEGPSSNVDVRPRRRRDRSPAKVVSGSLGRRLAHSHSPDDSPVHGSVSTALEEKAPDSIPGPFQQIPLPTPNPEGQENNGISIDGSKSTPALATIPEEKHRNFWSRTKSSTALGTPKDRETTEVNAQEGIANPRARSLLGSKRRKTQSEPFNESVSVQIDGSDDYLQDEFQNDGETQKAGVGTRTVSAPMQKAQITKDTEGQESGNEITDVSDDSEEDSQNGLASPRVKAPANTPAQETSEDVLGSSGGK